MQPCPWLCYNALLVHNRILYKDSMKECHLASTSELSPISYFPTELSLYWFKISTTPKRAYGFPLLILKPDVNTHVWEWLLSATLSWFSYTQRHTRTAWTNYSIPLLPPPRFSLRFVCQLDYTKTSRPNVMKLGRRLEHGPRKNPLHFRADFS